MNRFSLKWYVALLPLLFFGCKKEQSKLFKLVAPQSSNITFKNTLKPTATLNILDYMYFYNGGGVAIGDINNDGLVDLFFTGNQVKNKLYLNKGNFKFEDITEAANIAGQADWNTGATMADVNGDGLLDIYVCAVSGINGLKGRNELYINKGNLTFKEQAIPYGLGFENYSTQAAFFDYDNDGDLDMYLLNQSIHTVDSYGPASIRNKRVSNSGDKLLRNDNGVFVDVSEMSGIYGSTIGYGLGICTADFNNDGFVDIYVSNDFHENDYYYLNQGNGSFKEQVEETFGHISKFSMGSDASDINNDGYYDLITLDMMPEPEHILKASVGEDNTDIYNLKTKRLGYHHQYARNMLQINENATFFSETALLSGVSATDWSWSALFADFDLDGNQDLFISNGIPKRPNDLDYINYISNKEIDHQLKNSNTIDQKVLDKMPSGASQNYMYQGTEGISFNNTTASWLPQDVSFSNGSAYGDLDNDGDLDLVTNNINTAPLLYENTRTNSNHYLKIKLQDTTKNTFGIGSKVMVYQNNNKQYKQLFTTKGFQSSSELLLHFGFQSDAVIDSITVVWPNQNTQVLKSIALDTTVTIKHESSFVAPAKNTLSFKVNKPIVSKLKNNLGITHAHKENDFIDFNRQSLIPYKISDRTRAMAVGDLNADGKDDIFIGGSRGQKAALYLQTEDGFVLKQDTIIEQDAINEDIHILIADLDNQNGNDVLITSGGGEFSKKNKPLLDRLYRNTGKGDFYKDATFPKLFENSSVVTTSDIDKDGDLDLFIGSNAVANNFGSIPNSYILENTPQGFKIIENLALQNVGMVTDAVFSDYDADGDNDLIVVGEWMQPTFFQNNNGVFSKSNVIKDKLNGLWQAISPFDIDADGDVDYVLGNWGLNSKYKATKAYPMLMYYGDIDENGMTETILCIEKNSNYYTLNTFDELSKQLPFLQKRFSSYKDFAGKSIINIFGLQTLNALDVLEVHELASGYLKNNNGTYVFVPFETNLQIAPITNMLSYDFRDTGKLDLLVTGNYMGVTPYHGRFDGFMGALLTNKGDVISGKNIGLNTGNKQVSHMEIVTIKNKPYVVIMINNGNLEMYEILK